MKISNDTLAILKNFASINSNVLIKPGNMVKTISPVKNVLVESHVTEDFPVEFGVWDLNKFLATVNLFTDPIFNFEDKYVTISESGKTNSVKYYYADASLLTVPTKDINLPEFVIEFDLTQTNFGKLTQAASTLALPDLAVETGNGESRLRVFDKKDPTSNDYSVTVGECADEESYSMLFKVENLKLLPGDYKVSICERQVAQFEHKTLPVTYWIALEPDTKYGK